MNQDGSFTTTLIHDVNNHSNHVKTIYLMPAYSNDCCLWYLLENLTRKIAKCRIDIQVAENRPTSLSELGRKKRGKDTSNII